MQLLKLRGENGLKAALEILRALGSGKGSSEDIFEEKQGEEGVPESRQTPVSERWRLRGENRSVL